MTRATNFKTGLAGVGGGAVVAFFVFNAVWPASSPQDGDARVATDVGEGRHTHRGLARPFLGSETGRDEAQQRRQTAGTGGAEHGASPLADVSLEQQIADLEKKLTFQKWLTESTRKATQGDPLPWLDALPDSYRPESFRSLVDEVLRDCASEMELANLDCSEPPCIVSIRHRGQSNPSLRIMGCPAWKRAFDAGVSMSNSMVDCPDGSQEGMLIMAPYWDGWTKHDVSQEERRKRFDFRSASAKEAWRCSGTE